jgi:hypothetical protein
MSQTTAVIYMDFIGYYALNKEKEQEHNKLRQLIFISQFLNEDEEPITRHHSFISTDKADSSFVRRAWTQLLTHSRFLQNIKVIYVVRDNGPHFRNYQNMFFESQIYQLFQRVIKVRSLPPHHSYNPSDAWGAAFANAN